MTDADSIWHSKTDDELLDAANALSDYTEEGEQIIRAELRRRGLALPPPGIGHCSQCGRSLHANDPGVECAQCGEPFPPEILSKMKAAVATSGDDAPIAGDDAEDVVVTLATFPSLTEASVARSALDAAGILSIVTSDQLGGRPTDRPWVDLIVRRSDREEAMQVLNEAGHQ